MAGNEDDKVIGLTRGWLALAFAIAVAVCGAVVFLCSVTRNYGREYGALVEKTEGFERLAEGHYTTVRADIDTIRTDIHALRLEVVGLRDGVDRKLDAFETRLMRQIASMRSDVNDL